MRDLEDVKEAAGLLSGVRIIELGHALAGPFAGTLCADFGAEVIKIEDPKAGDMTRTLGADKNGVKLWWKVAARNKKCITLNLKDPRGLDLCRRLIATADALIENYRPGVLARLGLGADALHRINPNLVILSVSGYGQTGPQSSRPGFGKVGEAMSGVMHLTGFADGPPIGPGFSLGDCSTGLMGAFGLMMALYHRDAKHGKPTTVDLALFETIARLIEWQVIVHDQLGAVPKRAGTRLPVEGNAFGNVFRCRDGKWVMIASASTTTYRRILKAVDTGDLGADWRFADDKMLVAHLDDLDTIVAGWVAQRDRDDVVRRFIDVGAACGPIYDCSDIVHDPQYLAREDVVTVNDPDLGAVRMVGVVPKITEMPGRVRWSGPGLGAHNREVLGGSLGLGAAEIAALERDGVI